MRNVLQSGDTSTSKPLELHIARGSCRDRRPQAPPPELGVPYLATFIVGVRATLMAQAIAARLAPHNAPPHSVGVEFCLVKPSFTPVHLRTLGCQWATTLPRPCVQQMLPTLTDLCNITSSTRGEVQREAAWGVDFLFTTLVLGSLKA